MSIAREYFATGMWPTIDPFLFSIPQYHWDILHEWLTFLIFYAIYMAGGYPLIIIFKTLCILALMVITLKFARLKKYHSPLVFVLLLLAIFSSASRLHEKASLFSNILTSLVLIITFLNQSRFSKTTFALPLVFLIWVNLHPGFLVGLAICGFSLLFIRHRYYLYSVVGSFFACLINPKGIYGITWPIEFMQNDGGLFKKHIFEYFSLWHPVWITNRETFFFLTLVSFCFYLLMRTPRKLYSYETGLFILFTFLGVWAVRFLESSSFLLCLLCVNLASEKELQMQWSKSAQTVLLYGCLAVLGLLATQGYRRVPPLDQIYLGINESYYPSVTLDAIEKLNIKGNIFNSHGIGSYLAWKWNHKRNVFIHEAVTDYEFFRDNFYYVSRSLEDFNRIMNGFKIEAILLTKNYGTPPLSRVLEKMPEWRFIVEDDGSMLFVHERNL
ncbi:MAG: hypothetical protein SGI74_05495 [Oligoflexia bacterium]|nr:hypothetical protein [Oligoflexia bacterium]